MPTTRRMAREASVVLEDKENEMPPSLRKMPVRRTTAKANNTRDRKARATALPADEVRNSAMPLSPKKNVQMPQTRGRLRNSKEISVQTSLTPAHRVRCQTESGAPGDSHDPRRVKPRICISKSTRNPSKTLPPPRRPCMQQTWLNPPADRKNGQRRERQPSIENPIYNMLKIDAYRRLEQMARPSIIPRYPLKFNLHSVVLLMSTSNRTRLKTKSAVRIHHYSVVLPTTTLYRRRVVDALL